MTLAIVATLVVLVIVTIAVLVWYCCCKRKAKGRSKRVASRSLPPLEGDGIELLPSTKHAESKNKLRQEDWRPEENVQPQEDAASKESSQRLAACIPPEWVAQFKPMDKQSAIFLRGGGTAIRRQLTTDLGTIALADQGGEEASFMGYLE